jgi:hypothetical protein
MPGLDAGPDTAVDGPMDAASDAGADANVTADAALDAGQDAALDAGQDAALDAGQDAALDAGQDAAPTCSESECALLDTECASGECNPSTGLCELVPISNGLACGAGTQDCATSVCADGLCVTTNEAAGAACGEQGVVCQLDDTCDGAGHCSAHGNAPNGTACGSSTSTACDKPDRCMGGVCSPRYEPTTTTCGDPSDSACDHPDHCDGSGSCTSAREPAGTTCGSAPATCMRAPTCDDAGQCAASEPMALGAPCGDASSSACDAPDGCDGLGTCVANLATAGDSCGAAATECMYGDTCDANGTCVASSPKPAGTACGSSGSGLCDAPDTCDGAGACAANHVAAGTVCSSQSLACENDDLCDANGVCEDQGFTMACGITTRGIVVDQGANTPLAGFTVDVLGDASIAADVSDADGLFTLELPAGVPVLLRVAGSTGRHGVIQAVYVTPTEQGMPRLSLMSDADALQIGSVPGADPVDLGKGMAFVRLASAVGGEDVSLSADSSAPFSADTMGGFSLSSTVQNPASPTVVFFNVDAGDTTVSATGVPLMTQCSEAYPSLSPWPIAVHSVTHVGFVCASP